MPVTVYDYTVPDDFAALPAGKQPALGALEKEIEAADPGGGQSPASNVSAVYKAGSTVSVRMTDALDPENKTALDNVIDAHTGSELAKPAIAVSDRAPNNKTIDGYRTTTATGFEVIRPSSYVEPGSNGQRSFDSSSADDAAAGIGARTIRVEYFNEDLEGPFTEDVTLNGTNAVNMVATDVAFVQRIDVLTAGAQKGNVGTIRMHASTGASGGVVGQIEAGDNETNWCHYYVPVQRRALLTDFVASIKGLCGGQLHIRKGTPLTADSVEHTIAPVILIPPGGPTHYAPRTPIAVVGPARIIMYAKAFHDGDLDWNAGFSLYEDNAV